MDKSTTLNFSLSWNSLLFFTWIAGFLIFLTIFIERFSKYKAIVKSATKIETLHLQKTTAKWQKEFRIKRDVRLVSSDKFLSPFTIGVFKPVIFLPEILLKKADLQTLETIIAHQMAHIKRLDCLWVKIQNIIQFVYFFHPLAWYANSQINLARERICDRMVLARGIISPADYGKSMITVLKMNLMGIEGVGFLPSFSNARKKFQFRLEEIKGAQIMKNQNPVFAILIIISLGILILPMSCDQENSEPVSGQQNSPEIKQTRLVAESDIKMINPLSEGTINIRFWQPRSTKP